MNIPLLKWNALNSTFSVYILNEMCVCLQTTPLFSLPYALMDLVFPLLDATILGVEGLVFHAVTNYPQSSWLKTRCTGTMFGGE
jgi:hypothetical protein